MTEGTGVDLATWFAEHELERCPECGRTTLVQGDGALRVCLHCGVVEPPKDPPDPRTET
jgi:NADH pyrophosphatase NudC (nudix superfamily)